MKPKSYYRTAWQQLLGASGFLLGAFPFAVASFSVIFTLLAFGVSTAPLLIGLVILTWTLSTARALSVPLRTWVAKVARRPILPPKKLESPVREQSLITGQPSVTGQHWLVSLTFPLRSTSDWRAVAYHVLIALPMAIINFTVTLTWWILVVVGGTYWAWGWLIDADSGQKYLSTFIWEAIFDADLPVSPYVSESVLYLLIAICFGVTLPLVTSGLLSVNWQLARFWLGASSRADLQEQVADLTHSRAAAAAAESNMLSQIERDLHDGPQQRLIRLQLDLATAQRRLANDPQQTAQLLAEAQQSAQTTLDELRALARGVTPPILADRGLAAAVRDLVATSAVPTELQYEIVTKLPLHLERNLYFVVAELLANMAKHSKANSARLHLREEPVGQSVVLQMWDDGVGGAQVLPGHGLAGLAERIKGIGGTVEIVSPAGGPTTVTVQAPIFW